MDSENASLFAVPHGLGVSHKDKASVRNLKPAQAQQQIPRPRAPVWDFHQQPGSQDPVRNRTAGSGCTAGSEFDCESRSVVVSAQLTHLLQVCLRKLLKLTGFTRLHSAWLQKHNYCGDKFSSRPTLCFCELTMVELGLQQ